MKVICFGASSSTKSINKKLAMYAGSQLSEAEVEVLDLNDYEVPIFSIDREQADGIPELMVQFKNIIRSCDGIIVSFAEHNGAYASAFKNIMDWISRIEGKIWDDKPFFVMATSPGGRGGSSVLGIVKNSFPYQGANIAGSFSLPSFGQNFSDEEGITDVQLKSQFDEAFSKFKVAMNYSS